MNAKFEEIALKFSKNTKHEVEVKINFEDSVEKGIEKSKSSGKLLVILFLEDTEDKDALKSFASVNSSLGDFMFVKSKYYKDSELAKKCGVLMLPAISLLNTINDSVKTLNDFNADNIKEFMNNGRWSGPRWLTNLKKATNTVKVSGKPLVVLFVDNESKSIVSEFSAKMLENLKSEATFCMINAKDDQESAKSWGVTKFPACFIVTNTGTEKEKKAKVETISFPNIRKLLKNAISEKVEWKCSNDACGKKHDEPSECCGKMTRRVDKSATKENKPAENLYFCKNCGKTFTEQKDCCGKPMTKLPNISE